jgi:hypothetical protein
MCDALEIIGYIIRKNRRHNENVMRHNDLAPEIYADMFALFQYNMNDFSLLAFHRDLI